MHGSTHVDIAPATFGETLRAVTAPPEPLRRRFQTARIGGSVGRHMFDLEKRGATTIVHVRGDIDVLTSDSFREALVDGERDSERIVISMLDCHYLDSTGLTVLISAQRRLGERLAVVIPEAGNVAKIIEIASLGQFLRIVASVEDATRAVTG